MSLLASRLLDRYLRGERFRIFRLVALISVSAFVFTTYLVRMFVDGALGNDLRAYIGAAARLVATGIPYRESLLSGDTLVFASGEYLYPPPLAQLLVPLTLLPFPAAYLLFVVGSIALVGWSLVTAWRFAGGSVTTRGALTLISLLVLSAPLGNGLAFANLPGPLMAAAAIAICGQPLLGGLLGALLKVAPGAVVLLTLKERRERRARSLLIVAALMGTSVLLSPQSWGSYFSRALPETLVTRDPIGVGGNPAAIARIAGSVVSIRAGSLPYQGETKEVFIDAVDLLLPDWVETVPTPVLSGLASLEGTLRALSLAAGLSLLVIAIATAGDLRRRHVAVAFALGGSFLIPWAFWDHYLLLLAPSALISWRIGDGAARRRIGAAVTLSALPVSFLVGVGPATLAGFVLLLDGIRRTRLPEPAADAR